MKRTRLQNGFMPEPPVRTQSVGSSADRAWSSSFWKALRGAVSNFHVSGLRPDMPSTTM